MRPASRALASTITALLLALGAVSFVGAPAQAATVTDTINGVTYTADSADVAGGATAIAYEMSSGPSVIVPPSVTLDGTTYAVTVIDNAAFRDKQLASVVLPDGLERINYNAFGENNLTTITIPNSVTDIGTFAFLDNDLNSILIGNGVTTIGDSAFGANKLTTVTIPNNVSTLGEGAFQSNLLTSVTLGSGISRISPTTFDDNALATINIPSTITEIGKAAFSRNLLTSVTIPAGVTLVERSAFDSNPGLTSVRFLGPAPTVTAATSGQRSFDTSSGSLKLLYPATLGEPTTPGGYTSPLWRGYSTAAAPYAGTIEDLQLLTSACTGTINIQLTNDISAPGAEVATACTVKLDLNGHDLAVRNVDLGTGTELNINDTGTGGTLTAKTPSTFTGAPIQTTDAVLVVEGGTVIAESGGLGVAAIGGGAGQPGGDVAVFGGDVTATALLEGGAGIGGGSGGAGGVTSIEGGTVHATAFSGAGIGGGSGKSTSSTFIQNGAVVTARSRYGAGIGGGMNGDGGQVRINDSTVHASGGTGIGGGLGGDGETTHIVNSVVNVYGTVSALGSGSSASSTVRFGQVTVLGNSTVAVQKGPLYLSGDGSSVMIIGAASKLLFDPLEPTSTMLLSGPSAISNGGAITIPNSSIMPGLRVIDRHYDVSFDSQGGTAVPETMVYASTFESGNRTLPTPSRAGHTFAGWNTSADGTGTSFTPTTTLSGSSTDANPIESTLYAQWEAVPIAGLEPTITGNPREGQTLTADEGPVTPESTTFTFQWKRYGTPIAGATSKTYKLKAGDVGRKLSVTITASSPGQSGQTLTSSLTPFVSSPNKRLILNTSTVKKGQSFNLIATGLKPKQTYVIWLSGKRSYIGFTDANGMVATSVKFPTSTNPGTRRVRVSGYTNNKRTFTVVTHVTYTK